MSVLISDSFKIRESTSDEWENIQFSINSPGVPAGGTIGQVLAKNSATDYDTEWINLSGIPSGGATGQRLVKASGTDYDTVWQDIPSPALYFQNVAVSATTGDIATVTNSSIMSNYVLVECVFANPASITTDVTWTTSNGSLVLNGTCIAATTVNVVLVKT